ncbi:ABC transporter ATP-binding protein [Polyangium sorediatum]|uniref:ABC transporter ATP-binding protein n=1 Tax=Polyangium sorediatum TaxID=889274 RepID=A0ABT6NPV9_9BACT|nr:ABC transporter ATP-binding protein [Polyangium sorediatum]MDI1430318.1 ABC transporter ATP-binding protein [Polyangium sorediatum]
MTKAFAVIEIVDLYKYYGERRAVGPLSFSIEAGEIVGLLGLNGAGKTTTLRILACDLLPSSGSVRVNGLDVVESPHEVRSLIGYLPDTPPLYGEMTVRAYLHFAARLRGLSKASADKRVPEVLEATSLAEVQDQLIASLSHGYKQRVGIAQAIVHGPKLLVLDEPISGLDPVQIVEMRELLRGLKGELTILLSSHILSEISETCDRLLVIRDGQIAASGTEAELSAKLLKNQRIEVTVRGDEEKAKEAAGAVPGVVSVEAIDAAESGEGVFALRIESEGDAREAVCRALVTAEIGLLEVRRGERELESVFLELAGAETTGEGAGASPKKKRTGKRSAKKARASAGEGDAGAKDAAAEKEDGSGT